MKSFNGAATRLEAAKAAPEDIEDSAIEIVDDEDSDGENGGEVEEY